MRIYHGHPSPASMEKVREAAPSHTHGAEWSDQKMTPHDWPYILDNGAFTAYKNGNAWDVDSFVQRLAEIETRMPREPDFVVLPDVVTSPGETLKRSRQWQKLLDQLDLPMALACQDGCDPETMASYARELGCCALFIGGTTEWKQSNAEAFVEAAHAAGLDAHIGRPNDLSWAKRIGADSVDTTSIVQNESFGKLRTLEEQRTLVTDGGTERWRIGHLFADHGAESEVLTSVGEVVRVTIEPEPNPVVDETIQMDLMAETPDLDLDLAMLHPRCTDASDMTSISGDPADHENQIPRAREIAEEIATDFVIENKPRDDLRDPTVLSGRMFGLPIAYERAFETSFPVKAPARHAPLAEKTVSPYFYADRSRDWWAAVKGYRYEGYPKGHLAKNALPAVYVQTILRSWLEARNERDAQVPQDNNTPAPREVADDQAELTEVSR